MQNNTTKKKPLAELRDWLADSAERCRAMRWFGPLFRVEVAQDIAADAERQQATIAGDAYSAEQSDLEAVKVLEDAARDGLTAADMPALAQACRLIRRSAQRDRAIAEAMGA